MKCDKNIQILDSFTLTSLNASALIRPPDIVVGGLKILSVGDSQ